MLECLFVAGPNGAGKSHFSKDISGSTAVIFDADQVKKTIKASEPDLDNSGLDKRVISELDKSIDYAIDNGLSFTFETNYRNDQLSGINQLKRLFVNYNYRITFAYFLLPSLSDSVMRVKTRVQEGGHDIPFSGIIQNYREGLANLASLPNNYNRVFIYNNGVSNSLTQNPILLLAIQDRKIIKISSSIPSWAANTINRITAGLHSDTSLDQDTSKRKSSRFRPKN